MGLLVRSRHGGNRWARFGLMFSILGLAAAGLFAVAYFTFNGGSVWLPADESGIRWIFRIVDLSDLKVENGRGFPHPGSTHRRPVWTTQSELRNPSGRDSPGVVSTMNELELLTSGDNDKLAEVFSTYEERLQRVVRFRLDRRLYGRVDTTDVLQDVWMEATRRITDYTSHPAVPFFIWLRQIAWQIIIDLHRRHLGAQKRNVSQEVSLAKSGVDTTISIAAQLVGNLTSPSQAFIREERLTRLREALDRMDEIDREVLALRHFEELSNNEVAEVLGLQKTAASNRYVRALKRLKTILEDVPDMSGTPPKEE